MNTKESIKNEIFTLESRELNEGKKVAFIAGAINRDIKKANVSPLRNVVNYRNWKSSMEKM